MTRVLSALAVLVAFATLPAGLLVSEDQPATTDPVHHALIQKRVGFYAVYLPPDYAAEANKDRKWPVCLILHGHGSSETGHGALSNTLGRDGVIYVAPRAPYMHKGLLAQGTRGYTAWPTWPESWGEHDSETFPAREIEKLQVSRLYTDWIAECLADTRARYRVNERRAIVVGHSQGAMFSVQFALHRPELVRAHFAYAGHYSDEMKDDIAAKTLKKHGIHTVIAHCEGDAVVPPDSAKKFVDYLKQHEVAHEALIQPGGSHSFTSKVMRGAQEFVAKWGRGKELPPLEGKLVVVSVVEDSQAAKAGLKADDVLVSYNGSALSCMDDLQAAIAAAEKEGKESVTLVWRRGEIEHKADVKPGKLGLMPADR